jgi:flotillin
MDVVLGLCLGVALGLVLVALVFVARLFLYVGRPNELLVFAGREQKLSDGSVVGYRVVHGGAAFRVPLLETVDRMSLSEIPIELTVTNAYSRGGIPLVVHAIANVKVSSDPRFHNNAIERFLGRDPSEIKRVAKETLEGHLRGIIARLTPEEVNQDRLRFADELVTEAGDDFERLGLTLDTLKVQSVSDDKSYLDSIGRERLANVLSRAEIAESTAKADAEEAQARAHREGQVAHEAAENVIKQRENDLRRRVAELEATARSEEEKMEQAARLARAQAEQRLQEVRGRLETVRLQADRVLPADAARRASEMAARAEAAHIATDGEALATVLREMEATWAKAGTDAKDIFVLQQVEGLVHIVAERVSALEVASVRLVDGGDGSALAAHLRSMPATVSALLEELGRTTGIDVPGVLAGRREA